MAARLARPGPAVAAALLAAVALAAWRLVAEADFLWAGSVDCGRTALAELTGPAAPAPADFFDPGPVCHGAAWVRVGLVVTSLAGVALALLWARRPGPRWPLPMAGAATGAAVLALARPGLIDALVLLWPLAAPLAYLAVAARRPDGTTAAGRAVAGALAALPLVALAVVGDEQLLPALLLLAGVLAAAGLARSRVLAVVAGVLLLLLAMAAFGLWPG
jgi:hypothetical protein